MLNNVPTDSEPGLLYKAESRNCDCVTKDKTIQTRQKTKTSEVWLSQSDSSSAETKGSRCRLLEIVS